MKLICSTLLIFLHPVWSLKIHSPIGESAITNDITIKLDMNFDYLFRSSYMPV